MQCPAMFYEIVTIFFKVRGLFARSLTEGRTDCEKILSPEYVDSEMAWLLACLRHPCEGKVLDFCHRRVHMCTECN